MRNNNLSGKVRQKSDKNADAAKMVAHWSARQLHAALLEAEKNRRDGKLEFAERICRKVLDVHPTYVGFLQTFGLIALEKGHYPQAVNCFLTAAAEAPDDWTNYSNLATAWLGLEVPQMAALVLRQARTLNPKDPDVHFMLGEVFSDDREYDQAMRSYRQALSLNPKHQKSLYKLCDCLISLGYFEEAGGLLPQLHKLLPDSVAIIHLFLQMPKGSFDIDFNKAVATAQRQPGETAEEFKNNRDFVRANLLDQQGSFDDAWKVLLKANATLAGDHAEHLKKAVQRRVRDLNAVNDMIKLPPPTGDAKSLPKQTVPLFILGPSRSGKTTIETLIASETRVKRGYENHKVEFAVKRTSQSSGLVTLSSLSMLPEPLHSSFAVKFRELITTSAQGAAVVTNTNPGLIGSAGRLAHAIPEARFVFMQRNQNDLALRILLKKYRTRNHHAYSLQTVRQYIDWYDKMVDTLMEKLPGRAVKLQYESMVQDPATATSAVLELCGLNANGLQLPQIQSDVGAAQPYLKWIENN